MTELDRIDQTIANDQRAFADATVSPPTTGETTMNVIANRTTKAVHAKRWSVALAAAAALLLPVPVPHGKGDGIVWRWTSIASAARDAVLRVSVDTAGKSDSAVATEVADQLSAQGVANPSATFTRSGNGSDLDVQGNVDGREVRMKRVVVGEPAAARVEMDFGGPGALDTKRRPGESDDALKQRIVDQLRAQGLDGDVEVKDGRLEVRIRKEVH
jgi:hypothetical protein